MEYLKIYSVMAVVFLAFDSVWLGVIAKDFYRKHIGHLLAKNPNLLAAATFYLLYLLGLLLLVVIPASKAHSLVQALWTAALFGLVCYGTYDLTNQALIKNWPLKVTLIDLAWGMLVTVIVATVGYWVSSVLFV